MKYFLQQRSQKNSDEGFYVKKDDGENKYLVKTENGKKSCLNIFDLNENVLIKIRKKLFRYDVVDSKDELLFCIKPKKKRYILISGLDILKNIRVEGSYSTMNFDIYRPEEILAQVYKKIVHVFNTYCCDIIDEKNTLYYIAISIVIDSFMKKGK